VVCFCGTSGTGGYELGTDKVLTALWGGTCAGLLYPFTPSLHLMQTPAATPAQAQALMADMMTLSIELHSDANPDGPSEGQVALAVARPEWLGLISHFTRMPADERMRVGHSIQTAVARNPFPEDGTVLSQAQQAQCDSFISDCVLLAALAEATTSRVLQGTAVAAYKISRGNAIKAKLH
jgi:hypothetical protein